MNVTRLKLPAVRAFMRSTVWAIQEAKLHSLLEAVEAHTNDGGFTAEEIQARIGAAKGRSSMKVQGSIAVLPLHGVISHRMNMMSEMSGGTSTEMFGKMFDEALADPNVGAIVLDIDSPGGAVAGTPELAKKIYDSRGTKPVYAVANGLMASAAYWIGSAADELIATPSSEGVGSIGVFTVHEDISGAAEKQGVKFTVIKSAAHKAEENPYEPLSDEAKAFIQGQVDEIDTMFVAAVAKHRGVKVSDVRGNYGEGRAFTAKQALAAGMIDRIDTLDGVLAKLGAGKSASVAKRAEIVVQGGMLDLSDPTQKAALADAIAEMSGKRVLVQASMGAGTTPPVQLTSSATQARTVPVENGNTAASGAASQDLTAVRAAIREEEGKRVREINALCTEHGMTLKAADYISKGLTVDQVAAEILKEKKTVTATNRAPVTVGSVVTRSDADPRKGFESHRDFLLSVIRNRGARSLDAIRDERLRGVAVHDTDDAQAEGEMAFMLPTAFARPGFRATVGSDEQGNYSNSVGGFLGNTVSQMSGMMQTDFEGDPTVGLTQSIPMSTTTVEIVARTDKNHTTSVSGGFTVARKAETAAATASRQSMEKVSLRASSLFGLAYATEELLADSPVSFAAIIDAGFRTQFGAHLLNEKIRGLGDGEFLGVLNADCTVSQAKESNQLAASIVTANILKMRSRCWGYGSAVWLANHDTIPQLAQLSIGLGTAGVLTWNKDVNSDIPDSLMGRPIYFTEYAATLGTVGDIMLLNLSQYLEGTYQPLQSAESIHVRFVNHERAFKLWMRNAGQPWWRSALTPAKSSVTMSPFVTLATRA